VNHQLLGQTPRVGRRAVLRAGGLAAAAIAGSSLIGGCRTSPADSGQKAVTNEELSGVLPKYIPSSAAKPDLPGHGGVDPGFTKYPADLATSVPAVPGKGSSFTAMITTFSVAPPAGNSYYKAINEALGADLTFQMVPAASYVEKVQALLASRNVPDSITLMAWALPQDLGAAADALFTDLSPYLAGDAVSAYPNLANIPTTTWSNAVFNGKLYALPVSGAMFAAPFFYRADIFAKLGLEPPKSADEWLALAKAATDPDQHRWATGDPMPFARQVFAAPKDWRKTTEGGLEKTEETEEFRAALDFSAKFYKNGYVHPDMVAGATTSKELFASGRMLMYLDGFGAWADALRVNKPVNPAFDMQAFYPFGKDGGPGIAYADGGPVYFTVLSNKLSKEKVEEYLRIADYIAAPFGTKEAQLIGNGVEGVHFNFGKDGAPPLTPDGAKFISGGSYGILTSPPVYLYNAAYPKFVTDAHAWEEAVEKVKVVSPVYGLHLTIPPRLIAAQGKLDDVVASILRGRATLDDLTTAVAKWKTNGGNDLRKLYEDAL
jgi:putative aldouronate transport system substrate-binding protein